jgi:hypothetical protein
LFDVPEVQLQPVAQLSADLAPLVAEIAQLRLAPLIVTIETKWTAAVVPAEMNLQLDMGVRSCGLAQRRRGRNRGKGAVGHLNSR